ncbi:unnamed protein product, partial [Hapterophycus canaliculatus]
ERRSGEAGGAKSGGGLEQPMSMWLSSTQPHIALWGGEAGGRGVALRSGRPAAAVAAAAGVDGDGCGSSAAPAEAGMDVSDVTPPFAESGAEGEGAAEVAGGGGRGGGGGGGGIDDGGCLLDGPVGVIRGQPGVMRYKVLNNRRHVLTEDDARPQPNVALWDVTKARQVEAYPPGTVLEDKERSLVEIISVRPWFTVDTRLGTPLVSLSESNVFDGELYAIDARGERQTFLASPPSPPPPLPPPPPPPADRANEEEEEEEGEEAAAPAAAAAAVTTASEVSQRAPSSSSSTTLSSAQGAGAREADGSAARAGEEGKGLGGGGGAAAAAGTGTGTVRASKGRSVQDEVKVNLGDAALRGLFSRWVDQHLRLHGDGGAARGG